jgi:hypothetical protein
MPSTEVAIGCRGIDGTSRGGVADEPGADVSTDIRRKRTCRSFNRHTDAGWRCRRIGGGCDTIRALSAAGAIRPRQHGPLDDPAGDAGYEEHPPRVGFFTDTSVCIGCKARGGVQGMARARRRVQPPRDVVRQQGHAGRETWRHVAFIERTGGDGRVSDQTDRTRWRRVGHDGRRNGHPEVRAPPGRRHRRRVPNRLPAADELRCVQAPHAREVSRRVPDGRVVPHRVRHYRCAARHLQWMRLLRVGLPVWGDRPRRG